jgi:GNAT superfamily N-acetyltransferase
MAVETEDLALDPGTVGAGVRAVFDDPGKGEYWVAEEDGAVVGCLLLTPEWSDWRNGRVLWIQSVYVVPGARGRGVFRHLYDAVRRRVEADLSLMGLRLYVDRRNTAAQRVYEAVGMSQEHYVLFEWLRR